MPDEAFNTLNDFIERGKVGLKEKAWQVMGAALNKIIGYRADTSAELAKAMFNADPAVNAALINRLRERMGRERFMYFTDYLRSQAEQGRVIRSGAAVAPASGQEEAQ